MVKLTGLKKIKTAVFISGTGSNLENLIKFSKIKKSPISIDLIFSNTSKNYKITEAKILNLLNKENIKFICLAGFMKILSKNFIKKFRGIIVNIHPSLLPKYKGLGAHIKAIQNKDKIAGCTVHFVTAKLDSGKIILQKEVKISKKDTPTSLAKKVLRQEHKLYPAAIKKILINL
jgi:phosphoribosylglycinamide formyltransferase-1